MGDGLCISFLAIEGFVKGFFTWTATCIVMRHGPVRLLLRIEILLLALA
jgi:hypothetical protein